jgi:AbrB family looped-hinge helix DNA binding protein
MRSTITARGQTVIPAAIRRQFNLSPSDRLEWIIEHDTIRVVPVRADPIQAFRGRGKGGTVARLLAERAAHREQE